MRFVNVDDSVVSEALINWLLATLRSKATRIYSKTIAIEPIENEE
jgi:hypothetical protein